MIAMAWGALRHSVKQVGRVVTPREAADALAVLYPALLRFARKQLRFRHLDAQLAEDFVQSASADWFAESVEFRGEIPMYAWLRRRIDSRIIDSTRSADALNQNPLSLDAQIEEE